jgi:hypothetical protein
MTKKQVRIDPAAAPEQEAEQFEGPDDRARRDQNNHELALRGVVGRFLGCSSEGLNLAAFVLVLIC